MQDFIRNTWKRCGSTLGGFEYLPQDGTEFLVMHPMWTCPAVVCKDSSTGKFIFVDPEFGAMNDIDYIVNFTNMWFYIYDDFPDEFYGRMPK